MKKEKLIHVLLVALLCYGQLVASIHAVGHFDTHVGEAPDRFTLHDHARTFYHAVSDKAHIADSAHRHSFAKGDSDAEVDCAIYHTYLNQGSVLCDPRHHVMVVLQHLADSTDAFSYPVSFAVQNKPIRGPPIIS